MSSAKGNQGKCCPLLNRVDDLVTKDMEKSEALETYIASGFSDKACSLAHLQAQQRIWGRVVQNSSEGTS